MMKMNACGAHTFVIMYCFGERKYSEIYSVYFLVALFKSS